MNKQTCCLALFLLAESASRAPAQQTPAAPQAAPVDRPVPLSTQASAGPVPKTYFGINLAGAAWSHPWPTLNAGYVRLFDSTWDHVELEKGVWTFDHLDADVARARQHHAELLLLLSSTPTWASARPTETNPYPWQHPGARAEAAEIADWETYVRTVATRYKGKVSTYELWNEPNQKDSYSGDVPHMVAMCQAAYRVLKEVDPAITVVSPSPAPGSGFPFLWQFLKTGKDTFDVLGYHFYDDLSKPPNPEGVIGTARELHKLVGTKPIWDTESGYYIRSGPAAAAQIKDFPGYVHVLDQDESAAAVARSYLSGWAGGIARFYWYAWAEPQYALVDDGGTRPKAATAAYTTVERWLLGATYQSLTRSPGNLWTLTLQTPTGKIVHIVWASKDPQTLTPPSEWKAAHEEDALGKAAALPPGPLTVGALPVLLR